MTKKSIIWLSIILFVLVLTGVLFGFIFCLRNQNVKILGDSPILPTKEKILETANLKNGSSIFMLDKEKAINNIETTYPYVKVIQIKTTNLTSIEIIVRARHQMYYTEFNDNYYILDEDLKVLTVNMPEESIPAVEPTNLTQIEKDVLNISINTKAGDFVGTAYQSQVAYELYNAMINTVTKIENAGTTEEKEVYFTRDDVTDMLKYVEFKKFNTFSKIIITTKHGVKLDIEKPTNELTKKINICFSTIASFLSSDEAETKQKAESGTIKIYYDMDGNQKCVYIPQV